VPRVQIYPVSPCLATGAICPYPWDKISSWYVDEGVLTLCENVCGSLREQLRTLSALVDLGVA
jgi:hypothetical protein